MINVDLKWLECLNKGDNEAYKILFDKYFFPLNSFVSKYLLDNTQSEDIIQDIFFDLWQKKIHFADEVSLKTYLYRSVRNKCLDILKHKKIVEKYNEHLQHAEQMDFFLNNILEEEVYSLLKEAIDDLPESTKEIFNLTFQGYKDHDIASMLGTSLDSVKSKKKRGKQVLKEKLKDNFHIIIFLFGM